VSTNQLEQFDDGKRQARAERAAQKSQQQTLRGYLPEERNSPYSEGGTDCVFLLPLKPAHQQQGRGIPTRDQKYERSRA